MASNQVAKFGNGSDDKDLWTWGLGDMGTYPMSPRGRIGPRRVCYRDTSVGRVEGFNSIYTLFEAHDKIMQ